MSLGSHHIGSDTELSYEFLPKHWGRGYAHEAAEALITYCFSHLMLDRVVAETQAANPRSRKLLERLGMTLDSSFERFGAVQVLYARNRSK